MVRGDSAKKVNVHVTLLFCGLLVRFLLNVQSSKLGGEVVVGVLFGLLLLLLQAQIYPRQLVSKGRESCAQGSVESTFDVPSPPSSAAASSPATSPSSSFLAFFFFFFIRPRSRPSSAASGGGVSVSGAAAEALLVDARASESCPVDGL